MKNLITLAAIMFLCLNFVGCSDDSDLLSPNTKMSYREIAYESLTRGEKESITTDWKDGYVLQGAYQKENESHTIVLDSENRLYFFLRDESISLNDNYLLIVVSFNTIHDALLGPITVIIDPQSETVIGYVGRI